MIEDIQKTIFLTYLTNYNIKEIFRGLAYPDLDTYIEDFLKEKFDKKEVINDNFVDDISRLYLERYEEMRYAGITFIPFKDRLYPENLRKINQPPPMLYIKGKFLKKINIAIVGTRNASEYAQATVDEITKGLSNGHGVVSGLAVGIDTIAHLSAIRKSLYTIAVMPVSLDHVYPRTNYKLANDIIEYGGCLLSELAIGINRGRKSFVERNRLQTGLSDFVAPIEMGVNSGTMHTVDFCIKQGKHLLMFEPSEKQILLSQYDGIIYLKQKKGLKKIIIKDGFCLETLINEMKRILNPTLF